MKKKNEKDDGDRWFAVWVLGLILVMTALYWFAMKVFK